MENGRSLIRIVGVRSPLDDMRGAALEALQELLREAGGEVRTQQSSKQPGGQKKDKNCQPYHNVHLTPTDVFLRHLVLLRFFFSFLFSPNPTPLPTRATTKTRVDEG